MLAALWGRERRLGERRRLEATAQAAVVRHLACLPHHVLVPQLAAAEEEGVADPLPLVARFGNSPERLLAVCEEDGHVNVVRTGEEYQKELLKPARRWLAHRDAVFAMCWSADDRNLLTGSGDYLCCLWDTEEGRLVSTFEGHSGSVKAIQFRDDNVFASTGRDGHILIWDVRVPDHRNTFGMAVKYPVAELRAAHTLRKSASKQRSVSSTPTQQPASFAERSSVTSVAFTRDCNVMLSGGADGRVKFWDARHFRFDSRVGSMSAESLSLFDLYVRPPAVAGEAAHETSVKRPHGVTCVALNRFGSKFLACSLDNHIYEYDLNEPSSEQCKRYSVPVSSFFTKACYSPDGMFIATGSSTLNVMLFDTRAQPQAGASTNILTISGGSGVLDQRASVAVEPLLTLEGHTRDVPVVDWSLHDNQLASCSDDGTTRLWTVQANRPREKRRRVVAEEPPAPAEAAPAAPAQPRIVQARMTHFFQQRVE